MNGGTFSRPRVLFESQLDISPVLMTDYFLQEGQGMRTIDMHNHMIAPEVVAFLEREGERYATRIVEREGRRFFLIQDAALRPINDKITQTAARLSDMDTEGIDIQAVSCVPFLMYPEVTPELG